MLALLASLLWPGLTGSWGHPTEATVNDVIAWAVAIAACVWVVATFVRDKAGRE